MEVWERVFGEHIRIDNVPTGAYPYAPTFRRIGTVSIGRQVFYSPRRVYGDVSLRYYRMKAEGKEVRRVVFLSRGEPTLDANLGREAKAIKSAGFSIEVLTSGATMWREDVRGDLALFDRVVLEVVAVEEGTWREVMRPHPLLDHDRVMEGIRTFAEEYGGELDAVLRAVEYVDYGKEAPAIGRFLKEIGVGKIFVLPEGGEVPIHVLEGMGLKVVRVSAE